jgi:hypothetical protein
MQIEPVLLSAGQTGRDFVITSRSGMMGPYRFEARLMDGSQTLQVAWTDSLRQTATRIQQVQELAGGSGSITRITGRASAELETALRTGTFNAQTAAQELGSTLGGSWRIDVTRIPGSNPARFDIAAVRLP